jgi:hypothetical protein
MLLNNIRTGSLQVGDKVKISCRDIFYSRYNGCTGVIYAINLPNADYDYDVDVSSFDTTIYGVGFNEDELTLVEDVEDNTDEQDWATVTTQSAVDCFVEALSNVDIHDLWCEKLGEAVGRRNMNPDDFCAYVKKFPQILESPIIAEQLRVLMRLVML